VDPRTPTESAGTLARTADRAGGRPGVADVASPKAEARLRYAVISDIHGNREALDTVLEAIEEAGCDEIICLGDIVGYGAEPAYCLDKVREVCKVVVAGNHDYAALGKINIDYFNPHARQATLWSGDRLS